MEQIFTIEEEKDFINNFFKDVLWGGIIREDNFTGEKYIRVYLDNIVQWQTSQDNSFSLVAEYNNKGNITYKITISWDWLGLKDEQFDNGHCFLVSTSGEQYEIPLAEASIKNRQRTPPIKKHTYIECPITEDIVCILTQTGTKISFRWNNTYSVNGIVRGSLKRRENSYDISKEMAIYHVEELDKNSLVNIDNFVDIAKVYCENVFPDVYKFDFSDEQIDDLFDYCQQAMNDYENERKKVAQNAIREQRKLQKAREDQEKMLNANKLEKKIADNVTPIVVDVIEDLFSNPIAIPEIKALKDYCDKNKVKSKNYSWLFSLSDKYDKKTIIEDVRRTQKKFLAKKITGKAVGLSMLAIACVLFGTCVWKLAEESSDSFSSLPGILQAVLIIGPMVFVVWGRAKLANPEIHFKETTTEFIKEFEKRFPNSQK